MNALKLLVAGLLFSLTVVAQEPITYQKPPQEILELIDIERAPSVIADADKQNMLLIYRDQYKSIAELSEQEMRLAGLRINHQPSRRVELIISSPQWRSGTIRTATFTFQPTTTAADRRDKHTLQTNTPTRLPPGSQQISIKATDPSQNGKNTGCPVC